MSDFAIREIPTASRIEPDRDAVLRKIRASRITLRSVSLFKLLASEMDFSMTYTAHRDEIFFHIASQKAARLPVMDLEIFGTPASLASPTIALQHLLPEAPVSIVVQAKPRMSWRG
jgi:hypothetical protein